MHNNVKKDFQKAVATARAERNAATGKKHEYPKAMMTGQQQAKGTATVNCSCSAGLAAECINHPAIVAFLHKYGATAVVEAVNCGYYVQQQIRINFSKQAAGGANND